MHVYEAEKRFIYRQSSILKSHHRAVSCIIDEYEALKKATVNKILLENTDKIRQVEELRYGILRDDVLGVKKHEMSLRGRAEREEDFLLDDKPRRKKDNRSKVKLVIQLDDVNVQSDLAEMRGEKRREELPDRRSKKRK